MNVFKFVISIECKEKINDIQRKIIDLYSYKSKYTSNYTEHVIQKWNSIDKENIKALYSEKYILTYSNVSKCSYYFIDKNDNDSIERICVDVIVISEINDICDSMDFVYKDIKRKLNECKLSIIDNKALLYIYKDKDIISTEIMIKANVISFNKFSKGELVRGGLFLILAIISLILTISVTNTTIVNILCSLAASNIFFIFTEIIMKINFKKEIKINDLTNWVEKEDTITSIKNQDTEVLLNPEC